MEDNKEKDPRKRGLVADVTDDGKKEQKASEGAKQNAKMTRQQSIKQRRATEERRRAKVREEREARARERAEKARLKAEAAKEKAARAKAERQRREESKNREYHLFVTGSGSYDTTLNKMFLERKPWEPEDPKKILSFMPGTVEQIMVKVGDEVKEGDVLMIFRAMKMSNRMISPVGGTVKAINVAEGANVPKNTVMIELS